MSAFSGKNGFVLAGASNDMNELLHWDLEYGAEPHSYASRAGLGAMQAIAGVESGTGNLRFNFDATNPVGATLPQGTKVALQLNLANGRKCTGTGLIGKHKYNVDISGAPETVDVPFVTDGTWTVPTA